MLEIAKKIYNGVTSERFTRLYLMVLVTTFCFAFVDAGYSIISRGVDDLDYRAGEINRTLEGMDRELGLISSNLSDIDELSLIEERLKNLDTELSYIVNELQGIKRNTY